MPDSSQTLPADLARLPALFDFKGKAALVTGAASGIGRAIAVGLGVHGADVVAADLNRDGAAATAATIRDLGRRALAIPVDVTDWDQVRAMVEHTLAEFGRIDVAFNVPGINVRKPALEMSPEEFRRVVDVNLTGIFLCAKAIGEVMVRRGEGRMVNVASMNGHIGAPRSSAYTAAKHGVVGLTKVLAIEWGRTGVRVNALAPGYTRSPLTESWMADPAIAGPREASTPLGRFADPWEMVGAALFMVSDASTFMTGASLIVDGGWTAQ